MPKPFFSAIAGYPCRISGSWWIPVVGREFAVSAVLAIDENAEATLVTEQVIPVSWYGQVQPHVDWIFVDAIYGVAGLHERPVSLLGCRVHALAPGSSTLGVDVQAVVDGLWIESSKAAVLSAVEIEIEHLATWSRKQTVFTPPPTPSASQVQPLVIHRAAEPLTASVDNLTISLKPAVVTNTDENPARRVTSVTEAWHLRIESENAFSLEDVWPYIHTLQDLVSFAVGKAAALTSTTLTAHQDAMLQLAPENFPYPAAAFYRPGRALPTPSAKAAWPSDMLLTAETIPFAQLIPRWFAVRERFRPVLSTLLGWRYLPRQYAEPMLSMAIAASEEAFRSSGSSERFMTNSQLNKARDHVKEILLQNPAFAEYAERLVMNLDNRITLDEKLRGLVASVGQAGEFLFGGHLDAWVDAAKKERNSVAHTSAAKNLSSQQLSRLSLATMTLLELVVLQQLGLDEHQLADAAERCRGHVPRFVAQVFSDPDTD